MRTAAVVSIVLAIAPAASAQPTSDTSKYQPAILELRGCIRSHAPPAYIGGMRDMNDAIIFFRARCYPTFERQLADLGAADAALGGFRNIVRDEWTAFMLQLGYR